MKIYRIHRRQHLPIDLQRAWEFFWTPHNLETITPAFLRFRITSEVPDRAYNGLIITYRIAAVAGIPMTWVTEIKHVAEPHQFADEQRLGPFRFWHHLHRFHEVAGGIVMEDIVDYAMPAGFLGRLVHRGFIQARLTRIFDFRRDLLNQMFPANGETSGDPVLSEDAATRPAPGITRFSAGPLGRPDPMN